MTIFVSSTKFSYSIKMAKNSKQKKNKTTSPLKWIEVTKAIDYLEKKKKWHELLIIAVGCYTGYRLVDLLKLKYEDFEGDSISVIAQKTGKARTVKIYPRIKDIIEKCQKQLKNRQSHHHLFVRSRFFSDKPISRMAAITRIKQGFNFAGIEREMLSGHTLRKTYALRKFEGLKAVIGEYRALNEVRKDLRHSSVDMTRRYLGIPESELAEILEDIFND